jgi:hypothetical protein
MLTACVDSAGREICQISGLCSPEEAMRLAKLLCRLLYQAFTLLAGLRAFVRGFHEGSAGIHAWTARRGQEGLHPLLH